jgi:AcrR family transcriptional regulator
MCPQSAHEQTLRFYLKTRDRILAKSLELFNDQGERLVSTNHIAAALGMSPGNLYYHFANKEAIIFELFQRYADQMRITMVMPADRKLTQHDKIELFERILVHIWHFRFLHRDLAHLIDENQQLQAAYRIFAQIMMARIRHLYTLQIESGLLEASADDIESLLINIWVITVSWVNFLNTTGIFGDNAVLDESMLRQGIYQVICLEAPYLRGAALSSLSEMKSRYGKPLHLSLTT